MDDLSFTVRMGEPVTVPGLATLDGDVQQVFVKDPTSFREVPGGGSAIDRPSPFVRLETDLANAQGSTRS